MPEKFRQACRHRCRTGQAAVKYQSCSAGATGRKPARDWRIGHPIIAPVPHRHAHGTSLIATATGYGLPGTDSRSRRLRSRAPGPAQDRPVAAGWARIAWGPKNRETNNKKERAACGRPWSSREHHTRQRGQVRGRQVRGREPWQYQGSVLPAVAVTIPGAALLPSAPPDEIGFLVVGISRFLVLASGARMHFACIIGIEELLAHGDVRPVLAVMLGC
jgi:hypothetical protein